MTVLSLRFQKCLGPFTMLPVGGSSEKKFSDICLTTSFAVPNFGNTSAMRVILFLKMLKFYSTFQKFRKN